MQCAYEKLYGCGKDIACTGCKHDPNHSEITREEFLDMNSAFHCGMCKHFQVDADKRTDTTCKRLDHKHFKFAVPWFKSYDCGQHGGCICTDFEPTERSLWLFNHWKGYDFLFDNEKIPDNKTIGICIDGNTEVRYMVRIKDFKNGTFIDENGNLKWVEKMYYKQVRTGFGYHLVHEYPDGTIK